MQHSNVYLSRLVRWVADTLKLGRPCKRSSVTGRERAGGKEEEPGSSKVTVKCLCVDVVHWFYLATWRISVRLSTLVPWFNVLVTWQCLSLGH